MLNTPLIDSPAGASTVILLIEVSPMIESLNTAITDRSSSFGACSPVSATVPNIGKASALNCPGTAAISEGILIEEGLSAAGKRTRDPATTGFSKVNTAVLALPATPDNGAETVFVPAEITSPFCQYSCLESTFGRLTVSSLTSVRYGSSSPLQATAAITIDERKNNDFFMIILCLFSEVSIEQMCKTVTAVTHLSVHKLC